MFFSVKTGKLTVAAALAGGLIGFLIFIGAGFAGLAMLAMFFLLGVVATSWKTKTKEILGAAEKNKGRRTAGQVVANGGVAALLGLLAWLYPAQQNLWQLMIAGSLSSATADTLSSELGTVYGKRFYNIINFKKDRRGENGVVSIEGSLFGLAGSVLMAVVYALNFGWNNSFAWIIIAGTMGNIVDSALGATAERKNYLQNNGVNFLNTATGALVAVLLVFLF